MLLLSMLEFRCELAHLSTEFWESLSRRCCGALWAIKMAPLSYLKWGLPSEQNGKCFAKQLTCVNQASHQKWVALLPLSTCRIMWKNGWHMVALMSSPEVPAARPLCRQLWLGSRCLLGHRRGQGRSRPQGVVQDSHRGTWGGPTPNSPSVDWWYLWLPMSMTSRTPVSCWLGHDEPSVFLLRRWSQSLAAAQIFSMTCGTCCVQWNVYTITMIGYIYWPWAAFFPIGVPVCAQSI